MNASTGTTPYEVVFGFKPQIPISLKLGLVRDDNDLCQSEICQSLPDHSHVNKGTNHSCMDTLLTSKCSMDLLQRETQIQNIYQKLYTTVRKANHCSLMYRNKYKLAIRVGQKVLLENHQVPFGKSQKLCELRSGPYTVTKVITKVNYEVALDSDPTRIQVVHRNHLVEFFPRDNDLSTLLSNYEKPVNDDRTEHFYNEYAKNRLPELNQLKRLLNDSTSRIIYLYISRRTWSIHFNYELLNKFTRLWHSSIISSYSHFISRRIANNNQSAYHT